MRVDGNATAIIGDRHETVGLHFDFNPVGVTGERLVHGVVDHFGKQMMQRFFVGPADIHAGTAPDRLETLQNFDVLGGVAGLGARPASCWCPSRIGLGTRRCLWRLAGGGFRVPHRIKQIGLFSRFFSGR